ncbi:hypothetical protein RIF29_39494 [Crotalaria pallida]|uniref:Uncharacterized protein n=1 Tax=Crotalaria pallida TaxID=3830 RepID=A0AAN9E196_CROPI
MCECISGQFGTVIALANSQTKVWTVLMVIQPNPTLRQGALALEKLSASNSNSYTGKEFIGLTNGSKSKTISATSIQTALSIEFLFNRLSLNFLLFF